MCLHLEFFIKREATLHEYEQKGYVLLDDFLDQNNLSEQDLLSVGFLKKKEILSTADLSPYEVSVSGRLHLKELKADELIFVKENQVNALYNALSSVHGMHRDHA